MYKDKELVIRPIEKQDLSKLWELIYKEAAPEWKKWDATYFPHKSMPFEQFMKSATTWVGREDFWSLQLMKLSVVLFPIILKMTKKYGWKLVSLYTKLVIGAKELEPVL